MIQPNTGSCLVEMRVYKDITMTDIPFSELADKYSFSSPAYFATYCKKTFGRNALELRREKRLE